MSSCWRAVQSVFVSRSDSVVIKFWHFINYDDRHVQWTMYKPSLPRRRASHTSSLRPAPPATLTLAGCSSSGTRQGTGLFQHPEEHNSQVAADTLPRCNGPTNLTPPPQISAGCMCCHRQQSTPPPAGHLLPAEPCGPLGATADPRSFARRRAASASWGHPEVRGRIYVGWTWI